MQLFGDAIRVGIHAGQHAATYDQYLRLWETAEALGYDWASVFDHFIPMKQFHDPNGPCLEGMTLLAAMAARTRRLRCGILVVGVTYRNPGVLAKEATTIDQIAHGRLEFGLGAGWYEEEHDMFGIPFPSAGTRIAMLDEACQILKALWTEPYTTFDGRSYHFAGARCEPKGAQQPSIPLWIGGAGEQKTLRVVAKYADGWNTFALPLAALQHKLDVLAGHCRDAGRDPADIRKSLVFRVLLGKSQDEVSRLKAAADARVGFVGTPDELVEYLLPYTRLGVGDFLFGMAANQSPEQWHSMELIAKEVAPAIREAARATAR